MIEEHPEPEVLPDLLILHELVKSIFECLFFWPLQHQMAMSFTVWLYYILHGKAFWLNLNLLSPLFPGGVPSFLCFVKWKIIASSSCAPHNSCFYRPLSSATSFSKLRNPAYTFLVWKLLIFLVDNLWCKYLYKLKVQKSRQQVKAKIVWNSAPRVDWVMLLVQWNSFSG